MLAELTLVGLALRAEWGRGGRPRGGLTVSVASEAACGDGVLAVLSDGPDWEVVLPQGHWRGWLQDGDRVSGDPRGHLAGHRLDHPAGGGDPASGSFPMSQFFASSGQRIGPSASASVLPVNI